MRVCQSLSETSSSFRRVNPLAPVIDEVSVERGRAWDRAITPVCEEDDEVLDGEGLVGGVLLRLPVWPGVQRGPLRPEKWNPTVLSGMWFVRPGAGHCRIG